MALRVTEEEAERLQAKQAQKKRILPKETVVACAEKKKRQKKYRGPNKLETEFATEFLESWKKSGWITEYMYEGMRLRYGPPEEPAYYTPDYVIFGRWTFGKELVFIETKGPYTYPGARERFLAAAGRWPQFSYVWFQKSRKKHWSAIYSTGPLGTEVAGWLDL